MVRDFAVRKHRAPKGALRQLHRVRVGQRVDEVRKHRAPKGALRPAGYRRHGALDSHCQKAPSAIRCIKTRRAGGLNGEVVHAVKKHRAPKGALRRAQRRLRRGGGFRARKHRAPDNFACNSLSSNFNERRKPRHLNDADSSLEGVEAELHATFSSNPPR